MILNAVETLLVNNPVRGFIQRNYEGPLLRKLGGRLDGARVLEAGSGQGMGVRILLEQFGAEQVCAIDLDPRQVHRAKRKLTRYTGRQVVLAVASVEQLPFPDEFLDAVFDFGTLHHVPAWQAAAAEIRRVLKPAARCFFEEVTKAALNRWLYRALLDHPTGNRFSEAEFVDELAANGIALLGQPRRICANDIFVGVGQGHALQSRCPWACGRDVCHFVGVGAGRKPANCGAGFYPAGRFSIGLFECDARCTKADYKSASRIKSCPTLRKRCARKRQGFHHC